MKERVKEAKEAKKRGDTKEKTAEAVSLAEIKAEPKEEAQPEKKEGGKKGKKGDKKAAAAQEEAKVSDTVEPEKEVKEMDEEEIYSLKYSKDKNSAEKVFSRHNKRKVHTDTVSLEKFAALPDESTEAQPESK